MSNLIAHRALDNYKYKENTKDSVMSALSKSYIKGIEIDVRMTKDNKIVLCHDSIINRTSNGSGIVEAMTLKKLRKYNFGTKENPCKITILKDILDILPNNKVLLIEIKCHSKEERFAKYFYKIIKDFLDKKVYVMSFNKIIMEKLKSQYPSLKCGLLISKIINAKYLNNNFDFISISSFEAYKVKHYKKPIFVWALSNKKAYKDLVQIMPNSTFYIVDYPKRYIG